MELPKNKQLKDCFFVLNAKLCTILQWSVQKDGITSKYAI